MKKLITLFLILACMMSFAGCNKTSDSEDVAVGGDLRPMVMVEGVLYLDTNIVSTTIREDGLFDGEITTTVDRNQTPVEDNQSNFGTGYGYQFGTNDTIEIYINEKWVVFEAEVTE